MPSAGECIAGRYRLESPLGEGGMGSVWRAQHLELDAPVAIKFQHAHRARSKGAAARFRREARAAAKLRNPHVVRVVDFGFDSDVPYIAMELLEGQSLKGRLEEKVALSLEQALEFARQAANALDAAHEAGIIHRDLKPSNLFVVKGVEREIVKLLDFGIAKWFESEDAAEVTATEENLVLGSTSYMSPEQARGEIVDRRSDIWSLGVVGYEMLVGSTPFCGANVPDTLRRICSGKFDAPSRALGAEYAVFDPIFALAFELNPKLRFASAGELSDALCKAGSALGKDARSSTARSSTTGWAFGREGATLSVSVGPGPRGIKRSGLQRVLGAAAAVSLAIASLTIALGVRPLSPAPVEPVLKAVLAWPRPTPAAAVGPEITPSLQAEAPATSPPPRADAGRAQAKPLPARTIARRGPARAKVASASPASPVASAQAPTRLDPVFGLEVPSRR